MIRIGKPRLSALLSRRLALLATVTILFSCGPSDRIEAQTEDGEIIRSFERFSELHDRGEFNGVVLLARNGKILYHKALGIADYRTNRPLRPDSIFNLASVSKPITATAVLILAEQGKLKLQDRAVQYIPELAQYGSGASRITIEQLLNHTSGLPDYEELADEYFDESGQPEPIQDFVTNSDIREMMIEEQPGLQFAPGSEYSYSNTGYLVLADIVEKASGESFPEFLQQQIFKPLRMKNTSVCTARNQPPEKAIGFYEEDGAFELDDLEFLDGVYGDGNVCSTVEDLLKFDQGLRTGKLLKSDLGSAAVRPGTLIGGDPIEYGYGWEISESGLVSHTGSWTGFRTYFIRDLEEGYTVIVLDNSSNDELYEQVDSILEAAFP